MFKYVFLNKLECTFHDQEVEILSWDKYVLFKVMVCAPSILEKIKNK